MSISDLFSIPSHTEALEDVGVRSWGSGIILYGMGSQLYYLPTRMGLWASLLASQNLCDLLHKVRDGNTYTD